jgi:hypothetical protein
MFFWVLVLEIENKKCGVEMRRNERKVSFETGNEKR